MFEKISGILSLIAAGLMLMIVGLGVALNNNRKTQKCEQQIEPPDHIIY